MISQGGRKGDHGEEHGRRTGETQRDGDHVTEREHSPLLQCFFTKGEIFHYVYCSKGLQRRERETAATRAASPQTADHSRADEQGSLGRDGRRSEAAAAVLAAERMKRHEIRVGPAQAVLRGRFPAIWAGDNSSRGKR